jgi:hypothetical protein
MDLVHPQGGDFEGGIVVGFVDPVTFKKAGDEVIGVGADVVSGR